MKTTPEHTSSFSSRLDEMNLSELDRIMAAAYVQRGEYVAELAIRAARAVRGFAQSVGRGILGLFRPRQLS